MVRGTSAISCFVQQSPLQAKTDRSKSEKILWRRRKDRTVLLLGILAVIAENGYLVSQGFAYMLVDRTLGQRRRWGWILMRYFPP